MALKKKFSIFIVFILFIFALLTYQGIKKEDQLSFNSFLSPIKLLEQGMASSIQGIKKLFRTYVLVVGKEEANRELTKQVEQYEQEKHRYLEATAENERLRDLLELKSDRANYVTAAEVFARDPTNWFQSMWINKGEREGITKDMVAVTPLGAVGRIHRVLRKKSQIILVTDINSSIAVRIQPTRVEGILEGSGDRECYLKYIPRDLEIAVGSKLITSGLDGIYPEGIPVGYITDIREKPGEFFHIIEAATLQNLNAVEEVAILKR
jgi:rod shape-determining protein MreC